MESLKKAGCLFLKAQVHCPTKSKTKQTSDPEKIPIIHLWHGRLHSAEPNPGAPVVPRAPRPASPPTWCCPPAGWGPAPAQNLNWRGTVPRLLHADSHLPWQYSFWTGATLHLANSGSSQSESFFFVCSPTPLSCLGASP